MKRKQRRKNELSLMLQLCLFDEQQMQELTEPKSKKPAVVMPVDPDPTWIQWQLQIGEGLRGQSWREHRAMLIGTGKKLGRPNSVKPARCSDTICVLLI